MRMLRIDVVVVGLGEVDLVLFHIMLVTLPIIGVLGLLFVVNNCGERY